MNFDFSIGKVNRPAVTITRSGFSFNRAAIDLLGVPMYIAIGLDKQAKKIAFKALTQQSTDEPSYPFATSYSKQKRVYVTARLILKETAKLLPEILDTGGIIFTLEPYGGYGVIDLLSGVKNVPQTPP